MSETEPLCVLAPPQSLRDASCATPGFLRLPREIRDMIYDYIFVDVCVSTPDSRSSSDAEQGRGWHPKIELLNTTAPALLRVNKQISGEYCERMRPAAVLKIHVWSSDIHHPQGLPIQARVPMEAISAAKQCHLPIVWDYLITSDNIQRYGRWFRDCLPEQLAKQETLWWTPSKHIRASLQKFRSTVQAYVHPAATLDITFTGTCAPHAEDTYCLSSMHGSHYVPEYAEAARYMQSVVHAPTIFGLEHDSSVRWPAPGNLRMGCILVTSLFSLMPENMAELRANRRALEAGETKNVLQPHFTEDVKSCLSQWRLRPTKSECNYRGFAPEFLGWRDASDTEWRCE